LLQLNNYLYDFTSHYEGILTVLPIESRAKALSPELRGQLRLAHSRPVLAKIEALLLQYRHAVTPNSLLGKALHYLSSQWPKLTRFVDNGAWPIDNNLCENAIRPFVVGRRNWLFCDTVAGARASANLYSLIETCKANGIDPYTYLVDLFPKLPLAKRRRLRGSTALAPH
jgi:transposase